MRPSTLDDLGMEAAIEWLCNTHLKDNGIEYFLKIDEKIRSKRFSPEIEITIFRIIQEAITNIARHSNAKNAFINMAAGEYENVQEIIIDIEDDGDGFEINSVFNETSRYDRTGRGLGLLGMKERASLVDGRLKICSAKDAGTRITLRVPIPMDVQRRDDDKGLNS
jgi:signal transduction histidine kinase